MQLRKSFLLSALVVVTAAVAVVPYARGADSKKGGAGSGVVPEAPVVPTLVPMMDGLKWGMTHVEVVTAYNKIDGLFDREYNAQLQKLQPGVQMRALEAERDNRKSAFERSFIEFKDTPTGYDATALKGEYSYRNHESIMTVERNGKRRFFFFIGAPPGDRLWKVYDEVPLADGAPLGKTYQEAVTKLQTQLGVAARIRAADPAQNLGYTTADWQDASSHLRALDRSQLRPAAVGVVMEERSTMNNIGNLRSVKAEDPMALDPSISAVTRGGLTDPNAHPAPSGSAAPKPKKK
jgi:hypothetical protein